MTRLRELTNGVESHFRNTQRQMPRTTAQEGQTRCALQRTGAWDLLPRPTPEAQCLSALQVPQDDFCTTANVLNSAGALAIDNFLDALPEVCR
jgi:hypothetical protein